MILDARRNVTSLAAMLVVSTAVRLIKTTAALAILSLTLYFSPSSQAVTLDWAIVGNPGNASDSTGFGAVASTYRISKHEVTTGQYTEFLNAVAAADTYGLYSSSMWSDTYGCKIQQSGSAGSYSYSIDPLRENRPVNYVSFKSAMRFTNWLENGQPTGTQNASTTEAGVYTIGTGLSESRDSNATYFMPSENEWYKAAYHKNDGVTNNYWNYPTQSNTAPGYVNNSGKLSGTGTTFTEGGTDPGNYATYDGDGGTDGIGSPFWQTNVGEFENSQSPYGTFDQGGNVWEWNEAIISGTRALRGGSFNDGGGDLLATRRANFVPSGVGRDTGFRVAGALSTDNSRDRQAEPPATVGRLAEWDGLQWVDVTAGSLGSGNVRVLTHGWGRDQLPWLENYEETHGIEAKVWDMRSVNGNTWFDGFTEVAFDMEIANSSDRIVAFSWIDLSATDTGHGPVPSRNNTDDAASLLASALFDAGVDGDTQGVHLVGHSHGARVSTLAAGHLEAVGVEVDQLTLLDSPEDWKSAFTGGKNSLQSELDRLDIGENAGQTFVDNYVSSYATPYNGVVNVTLSPHDYGVVSPLGGAEHGYPINWYTDAVPSGNGFAWSPVGGLLPTLISDAYSEDPTTQYLLNDETLGASQYDYSALQATNVDTEGNVSFTSEGTFLQENSPAFWDSILELDENVISLQFDYEFLNLGDGDQLGIWIDDELRTILTGTLAGSGLQSTTIDVSDLGAGSHLMTVALHSIGDANAEIFVGNFQAISVVPEPSSLTLLAVSGLLIAYRSRR